MRELADLIQADLSLSLSRRPGNRNEVETVDRHELRGILAELLEETTGEHRAEVGEDEKLQEGLGLDSVDIFSLIVEIQNKLRIKIASEELMDVSTVGDLLNVLQAKLAAMATPGAA